MSAYPIIYSSPSGDRRGFNNLIEACTFANADTAHGDWSAGFITLYPVGIAGTTGFWVDYPTSGVNANITCHVNIFVLPGACIQGITNNGYGKFIDIKDMADTGVLTLKILDAGEELTLVHSQIGGITPINPTITADRADTFSYTISFGLSLDIPGYNGVYLRQLPVPTTCVPAAKWAVITSSDHQTMTVKCYDATQTEVMLNQENGEYLIFDIPYKVIPVYI